MYDTCICFCQVFFFVRTIIGESCGERRVKQKQRRHSRYSDLHRNLSKKQQKEEELAENMMRTKVFK